MTRLLLLALMLVVVFGGLGVFVATTFLVGLVAVLLLTAVGGMTVWRGRGDQPHVVTRRDTR